MARSDVSGIRRRRQWSPDARALGIVGDRWILLIARELAFGAQRLSELQRAFPGMSTGALEQRLNRMTSEELVVRHRYAEVPPRVEFELTDAGRDMLAILAPMVRWALRWAWSAPQPDEWVDVTAMFRLAGCVVAPPADVAAEVELIVEDEQGVALDLYTLRMASGAATVVHRPAGHADAVIKATSSAWAQALGPAHTIGQLRIAGDRGVAELFLAGFRPPSGGPR
ncbi:MAG TPA: winged helix-turn-helix transcriptional regulator [Conexibacter sp.]|nr:winged helix-turn-helix transcriptional regulator [Conexibacter sp.]